MSEENVTGSVAILERLIHESRLEARERESKRDRKDEKAEQEILKIYAAIGATDKKVEVLQGQGKIIIRVSVGIILGLLSIIGTLASPYIIKIISKATTLAQAAEEIISLIQNVVSVSRIL